MTTAWWLLVAWFAFAAGFLCGCAWVASHQVTRKDYRNVLKLLHEAQTHSDKAEPIIKGLVIQLALAEKGLVAEKTNERFDWKRGTGVA